MAGYLLATLAVTAGAAHPASAQTAVLTLSGGPVSFAAPTGSDYAAGWIYNPGYPGSGLTYTLDITKGAANTTVTTTVSVRAATATLGGPAGYTKPIGDLQWARADQMAWTSLTTANVVVESRQMQKNKLNDAWANTLLWRMRVGWLNDPPGTYTTGPTGIVVTLSLTAP
jgi:hypothetical protein